MNTHVSKIPFSLVKVSKKLANDKDCYRARVKSNGTYTLNDVCKAMAERVPLADSLSTFQFYVKLFESTVRDLTIQGYRVKTDLMETGLSITGTFENVDDDFDALRHTICPTISATRKFKTAASMIDAENKIGYLQPSKICGVMDAETHRFNEISLGHEIHIQGFNLGINPDNPDEGVFLENSSGVCVASALVLRSDTQTIECRFDVKIPLGCYTMRVVSRNDASAAFQPAEATKKVTVVAVNYLSPRNASAAT